MSAYRLGDLVLLHLNEHEKSLILNKHPNTLGSKYILAQQKRPQDNLNLITKLVVEYRKTIKDLLPPDITESTLIHVRLGDVVAGYQSHEIMKRPLSVECLKLLTATDSNKKYVIGQCFFAEPSSRNIEECVEKSELYLRSVLNEIQAEYFNSGNADIDLCCAVSSKLFVQGKGFYSQLIVDIRKRLNLPSIECSTIS